MNISVKWIDGMLMVGKSGSGHAVVMDGPPEIGGENLGVRPMEMLLLGMAGCTMIDVVSTLKKMREDVVDCQTQVSADRSEEYPKVFTNINVHFILKGKQLNPSKVDKAIKLSAEKYCSASIMIGKTAVITHDFEIIE
ncbi:MAG: OsmC family protein [Candidatus Marinimicrobia bacterium]|nr:OsmC family protein [Candidatus Neomarinimicrobiota bacterium]